MSFFITLIILILSPPIIGAIAVFLMNISSSIIYFLIQKDKTVTKTKYIIGLFLLTIIDSYIFLTFISVSILFIYACTTQFLIFKIILWVLASVLSVGTAIIIYRQAKNKLKDTDVGKQEFIHVDALNYITVISFIGFILLAIFPKLISIGWCWVENLINSLI